MKKRILFILLFGSIFTLQAQQLNTVSNAVAKTLPDGWYTFEHEGAKFDVEVKVGYIVKGNIQWFNKDSFSGDLVGSELSGKGTYTWSNGEKYEGSFKGNQRHGKGTMYWKNGEKFHGKWKNNAQNGKGKLWKADGSIVEGVWENGVLIKQK